MSQSIERTMEQVHALFQAIQAGTLEVTMRSEAIAIAEGILSGFTSRNILGYNSVVEAGGDPIKDLSELGVNVIPRPSSAIAMEVVSSDAADTSAGTGVRTVEVHGLDANFDEKEETVSLNGTSAVALAGTWIRINNVHAETVGSGGVAAGIINVQASGGGTVYDMIAAGGNASLQCHFTIPNGKTGFILGWNASAITGAGTTKARLLLRATTDWDHELTPDVFSFQDVIIQNNGGSYRPFPLPIRVPSQTDIKVSAQRVAGTSTVQATADIDLFYS